MGVSVTAVFTHFKMLNSALVSNCFPDMISLLKKIMYTVVKYAFYIFMLALCNFFSKIGLKLTSNEHLQKTKGATNRNFFTRICVGFNVLHHIIIDITPITCKKHYSYVCLVHCSKNCNRSFH